MGIDYHAEYGIGYEVEASYEISDTEDIEDGLDEYLWSKLGEGFKTFRIGCGISGEFEGTYVTVDNPFKDGLDLTEAKARLDYELSRIKVEAVSEFNEVGGLFIC